MEVMEHTAYDVHTRAPEQYIAYVMCLYIYIYIIFTVGVNEYGNIHCSG